MSDIGSAQIGKRRFGYIVLSLLLILPALTAWNLVAQSFAPKLQLMIGPRLRGVTDATAPVQFNAHSLAEGTWQKVVMTKVGEAFPLRPLLIRLNNQLRYKLFGAYSAPGVVNGDNGQLIESAYLKEYCARNLATFEQKARAWIPKLKEIQDFYETRGHTFIYLTTPSKAAHLPEYFIHRLPSCASTARDRTEILPTYDRLLSEANIHFVDAARLTHQLKGKYEIDLFPVGGVHWNAIGVANAANAVLAEINARAKKPIAPKLDWTYEIANKASGTDRDLADLINVLVPNVRYPTPKVNFDRSRSCADFPASSMRIALIGGSFIHDLARTLINAGCLSQLETYDYLYNFKNAGKDYKTVKRKLGTADILPLRDADIVILEENEAALPGTGHSVEFHRILLGR
jgi:alginate O-acetyltransferase complex protein AlgJ